MRSDAHMSIISCIKTQYKYQGITYKLHVTTKLQIDSVT